MTSDPRRFLYRPDGLDPDAALRLTASYMDGDLLNQDFQGQRFLNLALGYTLR